MIQENMNEIPPFRDAAVIFFSQEDGCWIAHSLRTDQCGTGVGIAYALADLIRAVDQVCEIAREDETVAYLREAPQDIQKMAATGKKLPREIYEVAHKMARGQWPENIEPEFKAQDDQAFTAEVCEGAA